MLHMPMSNEPIVQPQDAVAGNYLARRVEVIAQIVASWSGYFVRSLSCHMEDQPSDGELTVRLSDSRPDTPVSLHLARIWYLKADGLSEEIRTSFVDEIRVTWLAANQALWPEQARHLVGDFATLPELVWVEMIGPWTFEAIAQIIDITTTPPELRGSGVA
jgi:hypothetical protein